MIGLEQIVIWNLPGEKEKEVRRMFIDKYTTYLNEGYDQEKAKRMARNEVYIKYITK